MPNSSPAGGFPLWEATPPVLPGISRRSAPLGVEVQPVPPVLEKGGAYQVPPASAGRCGKGEVEAVDRLLGRPFAIEGEVIHLPAAGPRHGLPHHQPAVPHRDDHPKIQGVRRWWSLLPDGRRYTGAANGGSSLRWAARKFSLRRCSTASSGDLYG